jgi:hypothetical protein
LTKEKLTKESGAGNKFVAYETVRSLLAFSFSKGRRKGHIVGHFNAGHATGGRDALSCPKTSVLAYEGAEIDGMRREELGRVVLDESGHLVEDTVASFRAAGTGGKVGGESVEDVGHLSSKMLDLL